MDFVLKFVGVFGEGRPIVGGKKNDQRNKNIEKRIWGGIVDRCSGASGVSRVKWDDTTIFE